MIPRPILLIHGFNGAPSKRRSPPNNSGMRNMLAKMVRARQREQRAKYNDFQRVYRTCRAEVSAQNRQALAVPSCNVAQSIEKHLPNIFGRLTYENSNH